MRKGKLRVGSSRGKARMRAQRAERPEAGGNGLGGRLKKQWVVVWQERERRQGKINVLGRNAMTDRTTHDFFPQRVIAAYATRPSQ